MLRWPRHSRREQAAAGHAGYRPPSTPRPGPSATLQPHLGPENSIVRRALGACAWAFTGGLLLFAFWELGNFGVLIGNGPLLRPAAGNAPAFRPAAGPEDGATGCTQAAIDRATGMTIPADCHT